MAKYTCVYKIGGRSVVIVRVTIQAPDFSEACEELKKMMEEQVTDSIDYSEIISVSKEGLW